ncbi:ribonuclease J [Oceanivirga salmonicida]|uniref:ribonuclease J n=1 Tax=Oceanivirga salmonicida TaxID=1769291 RepID=UPI001E2E9D7C|nr:ribonuclease J [Oceanivirga salmonicida]
MEKKIKTKISSKLEELTKMPSLDTNKKKIVKNMNTNNKNNNNNNNRNSNNNNSNTNNNNSSSNSNKNNNKNSNNNNNGNELEKTYIIPLGGLEEVGKNMNVIQYKDEMIMVDAGLAFPSDEHLGIDIIIPNLSFLENNANKLKALLLTHGHEDHIGAVPYVYQKLGNKMDLYGTKLTVAFAKAKFERKDIKKPKFKEVKTRQVIKLSKYFTAEFISVTHSIADSCAICIKTPSATILHTGDYKIDLTPVKGDGFDFLRMAQLGEEGVDLLMADSTNSLVSGYTPSEKTVGKNIDEEVSKAQGRVIIAAFASHVHRIQQIVDVAVKYNRKIAVDGRSMLKNFDICKRLGYLDIPKNLIINIEKSEKMQPNKVMILCTGTQGEPLAALSKIANGTHKFINLRENDTVIISSTPIPGNEKATTKNVNQLLKRQADVVFERSVGVHVSGHASQDEQKLLFNLIKPKYFMPVHGEYAMLKKYKETAIMTGVLEKNVILAENGFKIGIDKNGWNLAEKVPSGLTLIDGSRMGDVGNSVLKDRQSLADDGIFVMNIPLYKNGKYGEQIEIATRGFVYIKNADELLIEAKEIIKLELKNLESQKVYEISKIKQVLRRKISDYLYKKTGRSPMILPIVIEV